MSRREKDKQASLDALAKIAYSTGGGAPPPPPKPQAAPSSLPRAAPRPTPKPKAFTPAETELDKKRRAQIEERKAKLEEEKLLRQRRANELARGANLPRRGMDNMGIPASIRRTGFDREEPTVAQKLHDILGEAKLKESREKARDKGRRQGGR